MPAQTLKAGALVIVAFAIGLVLAVTLLRDPEPPQLGHATLYVPPSPLPDMRLIDQQGKPFARSSLEGHWWLVFFGFTNCPDVCPTTLATLVSVKQMLDDLPAAQQPRVLLVTVDPQRDTPAQLAAYLSGFDPSFTGVTGEADALASATAAFGVPHAKVAGPGDSYSVDHGSGVFFVSPSAEIVAYSSMPHVAQQLADEFRKVAQYTDARG